MPIRPRDAPPAAWLVPVLLGTFGWVAVIVLFADVVVPFQDTNSDFFAFWTFARFAAVYPARALYDPVQIHAFQLRLHLSEGAALPFVYPPGILPLLWPLHGLALAPAKASWTILGVSLYAAALRGTPFTPAAPLAALALPATVFCGVAGQTGLLTGALFVAGVCRLSTAPRQAGFMLGLLCIKPQLCVLLPVALVAARQGRPLLWVALATLATTLLSVAMFGSGPWRAWLGLVASLPDYMNSAYDPALVVNKRPVVLTNLQALGVGHTGAAIIQLAVALTTGLILWRVFRRGIRPRAAAALWVGTFLATPYAAFYDEPVLTAAILVEAALSVRERRGFSWVEGGVLVLAAGLPLLVWLPPLPMVAPVVLAALFLVILRRDSVAPAAYRNVRPNSATVQPIA